MTYTTSTGEMDPSCVGENDHVWDGGRLGDGVKGLVGGVAERVWKGRRQGSWRKVSGPVLAGRVTVYTFTP